MRETIDQLQETTSTLLATVFGGVYLGLLYALTLWLVIGSLSAIQVRDRHEESRLPFAFTQNDLATARDYLANATSRVSAVLYDDPRTELQDTYASLKGAFPDLLTDEMLATYTPAEAMRLPQFATVQARCQAVGGYAEDNALGCSRVRAMIEIQEEIAARTRSGEAVSVTEREAKALAELEKLRAYSEFVDLYAFFDGFGYLKLLQAPREILVIVLTMVMGILGSVITMTWTFVRRDNTLSLRRFLLLPFVGGMSAFTILVFLKAGQLTLTAGASNDPLSPFFLSFIGIISGLLSERAYARMSEVGRNFFAVNEEQPRWGIDLKQRLSEAELEPKDLAHFLKIGIPRAENIVNARIPADGEQQRLLAAFLRTDRRNLFTDLPPDVPPDIAAMQHEDEEVRDAKAGEKAETGQGV